MSFKSLLLPLAIFGVLVVVLAAGFKLEDPHLLPSEMVNRPFPEFQLNSLTEPGRSITKQDLKGEVSLVNVWATWCANCVIEHPELMRIAYEEEIPVIGINYNDEVDKAVRWLQRYDNPYRFVMVDDEGKLGIDLGVYGAPETFIVDANGIIQHRHVGVVTRRVFEDTFVPIIETLRAQESGS